MASLLSNYDFTSHGAIRSQPVSKTVQTQIARAVNAVDSDLKVYVTSGGQPSSGSNRTGSHRHDNGGAADFYLIKNGQRLSISQNREIYKAVAYNLAAAGATGIGIDEGAGYIHSGGGSRAAWGYSGPLNGSKYLAKDFKEAITSGWNASELMTLDGQTAADVIDVIEIADRIDRDSLNNSEETEGNDASEAIKQMAGITTESEEDETNVMSWFSNISSSVDGLTSDASDQVTENVIETDSDSEESDGEGYPSWLNAHATINHPEMLDSYDETGEVTPAARLNRTALNAEETVEASESEFDNVTPLDRISASLTDGDVTSEDIVDSLTTGVGALFGLEDVSDSKLEDLKVEMDENTNVFTIANYVGTKASNDLYEAGEGFIRSFTDALGLTSYGSKDKDDSNDSGQENTGRYSDFGNSIEQGMKDLFGSTKEGGSYDPVTDKWENYG